MLKLLSCLALVSTLLAADPARAFLCFNSQAARPDQTLFLSCNDYGIIDGQGNVFGGIFFPAFFLQDAPPQEFNTRITLRTPGAQDTVRDAILSIENGAPGVNSDVLVVRTTPGPVAFPPLGNAAQLAEAVTNGIVSILDFSIAIGTATGAALEPGASETDVAQALVDGLFTQLFSSFLILELTPGPTPDTSLFPGGGPIEVRYLITQDGSQIQDVIGAAEPTSLALLGLGMLALARRARR